MYETGKRIFDILLSVALILIFGPILLLSAAIIKGSSEGSVIFKQRRIGRYKKEFYIYKFRTMYIDTPKDVPTHLLEDPYRFITPVGNFLRKTSLDELPQLFNILLGEMSFVGPRPALYNQKDLIKLRNKRRVNDIMPGLTGWAQVNGRDELEISVKVAFDAWYQQKRSFLLDIKILYMTFAVMLCSKGVVEGKK